MPERVATASHYANDQQLSFGDVVLTFDYNGNVTTAVNGSGTTTYSWNARNQLTAVSGPGVTATFGYDGLGRRRTKTINSVQTDVLYDGLNPVQEGVLPGAPTANLLVGLATDEYLTRTDAAGARHFLLDALGSTLGITDPLGSVSTEYTYEPFGLTTASGVLSSNPHQFTGRENDGTGLYYFRARYYHPLLSRFISEDPHLLLTFYGCGAGVPQYAMRMLGRPIGFASYAYAASNPSNLTDPLGLQPVDKGVWICPICFPPPGCTTEHPAGWGTDYTMDDFGRFQQRVICRFVCGSSERFEPRPCRGPYF
jgi:RHS repeat-associated protein